MRQAGRFAGPASIGERSPQGGDAQRGDTDGRDWDTLIRPLNRGTFDNRGLLKLLREIEYRGPIGLQGYGVPGDKAENLRRSITAWKMIADER